MLLDIPAAARVNPPVKVLPARAVAATARAETPPEGTPFAGELRQAQTRKKDQPAERADRAEDPTRKANDAPASSAPAESAETQPNVAKKPTAEPAKEHVTDAPAADEQGVMEQEAVEGEQTAGEEAAELLVVMQQPSTVSGATSPEAPVAAEAGALSVKGNLKTDATPPGMSNATTAVTPAPDAALQGVAAPASSEEATGDESPTSDRRSVPHLQLMPPVNGEQAGATSSPTATPSPTPAPMATPPLAMVDQASMGAPGPAAPDDDPTALNTARIGRGLQNAVQQNGGSVTLRLTPSDLGTVRIQMQLQGTTVSAQFHTETEAARSMLSGQLAHLRQALESQGLAVDRLHVQTMQPGGFSQSGAQQQGSEGAPHDGRSRGFNGEQQRQEGHARQDGGSRGRPGAFSELFSNEQV